MIHVVFSIERGDVGTAEGPPALVAEQAQSSKVIRLTKRIWPVPILVVGGEEFGCDNLTAILRRVNPSVRSSDIRLRYARRRRGGGNVDAKQAK